MSRFARFNFAVALAYVALIIAAAVALVPMVWLVRAAFTRDGAYTSDHFRRLLIERAFVEWLVNSIFIACTQTVAAVLLCSMSGFALAKYRFRARRALMLLMLLTVLLPAQVLVPSSYELIWRLNWVDTYAAILIPGAVSVFGVFLFRQAMLAVPNELLHAARVDGCGELRLWWEIAMPIARPMVGAFTLMSFIASWNSYLWPQIVLQDERKYTLPIGLANMLSATVSAADYGALMAGTLLSIVPVIALFIFLQRDFMSGLTSGALKG